ncbi:hypothetical protein ACHAW5_008254 [Stephanodiscus triporus]|uniref:Uncharacterized protein n=1 Tax=Stephanodiscus triporus TaxID=2934178 RepID=A0ABD3NJV7_9STRA
MPLVFAFIPHVDPSLLCKPKISSFAALSLSNQAEDHSSQRRGMNFDEHTNSTNKEKYTVARAGGRRPRTDPKSKQPDATKEKIPENGILSLIRDFALPLCVLTLILRFLFGTFGGNAGSPNVVYYSRSIYQSTTYTKDGNIERKRRENFQSNIPELVQQSKGYKQEKNALDVDVESYFNIIDGVR